MNFSIYPENKIKIYKDKILKHFSNLEFSENNNNIDLIFVFGGDGTFLKVLKKYYNQSNISNINEGLFLKIIG